MHAWRARLPQRFRRYCRSLLVRVEKLLGDFERAEFRVPSEDFVVLQKERGMGLQSHVVHLGWKEMQRCVDGSSICVKMGRV